MSRKAKQALIKPKPAKDSLVTMEIMENYLEPHFIATKQDFDSISKQFGQIDARFKQIDARFDQMDKRFDQMETTLKTILDIVRVYDIDRKEIKLESWEHNRRISKLEKSLV